MSPKGIRRDCTWLMLSLGAILVLSPFFYVGGATGRLLMSALYTLVLLGGIAVVSDSKRDLGIAVLLMCPALVALWIKHALGLPEDYSIWLDSSFYSLPLYFFLAQRIFAYIFRGGRVTNDHLHGAISLYLLLGLIWTNFYVILERLQPGSFRFPEAAVTAYESLVAECMYFSYVTLTTLGYGDIAPATPFARTLSIVEAITGVLFIGALIARIAGSLTPLGQDDSTESA